MARTIICSKSQYSGANAVDPENVEYSNIKNKETVGVRIEVSIKSLRSSRLKQLNVLGSKEL